MHVDSIDLPDSRRWFVMASGPDAPMVMVPIDQIEGLSAEEIGSMVLDLIPAAIECQATDIRGPQGPGRIPDYSGIIYLVYAPLLNLYKIGRTSNLKYRLAALRTLPFEIELITSIEATNMFAAEKHLHEKFAQQRRQGEWFELSASDIAWLSTISLINFGG